MLSSVKRAKSPTFDGDFDFAWGENYALGAEVSLGKAAFAAFAIVANVAASLTAMSASRNCTAWWSKIGWPKATRSRAYFSAASYAARAMPTAWLKGFGR